MYGCERGGLSLSSLHRREFLEADEVSSTCSFSPIRVRQPHHWGLGELVILLLPPCFTLVASGDGAAAAMLDTQSRRISISTKG